MSNASSSDPSSRDAQILEYGWTAQSCDPATWGGNKEYNHAPAPQLCADVPLPSTPLAQRALSLMKSELPTPTYNHSLRVFYYGLAIARQQFPQWDGLFSAETWLLVCLFHDIGTIDKHTHGTLMSFEFFGGFLALRELEGMGAPQGQRESVAEAIIRHQDPVETGRITTVGLLVQLATQFGEFEDSWFRICDLFLKFGKGS